MRPGSIASAALAASFLCAAARAGDVSYPALGPTPRNAPLAGRLTEAAPVPPPVKERPSAPETLPVLDRPAEKPALPAAPLPAEAPRPVSEPAAGPGLELPGEPVPERTGPTLGRVWADAEYLIWYYRDSRLPPLVSTSLFGTPPSAAGVLGSPGSLVLVGGRAEEQEGLPGFRFRGGFSPAALPYLGVDGSFFVLNQNSTEFHAISAGVPILARPFLRVTDNREDAVLVALPGLAAGRLDLQLTSTLWSGEVNLRGLLGSESAPYQSEHRFGRGPFGLRLNLSGERWSRLDTLLGVRWAVLDEELLLHDQHVLTAGLGTGTAFRVTDRFRTRNLFTGGQLGLASASGLGPVSLEVVAKVALGATSETAEVRGRSEFLLPGFNPVSQPSGLLALPTNSGRHRRQYFAVLPELTLKLGYQLAPSLRTTVGYNLLYWNEVLRPGEQIDRAINLAQLPSAFGPGPGTGVPRPAFRFNSSDFWVQGLTLGLEFRY